LIPPAYYYYAAGDVNGNCEFRGSDITTLVAILTDMLNPSIVTGIRGSSAKNKA
jgi:hypothetical protein